MKLADISFLSELGSATYGAIAAFLVTIVIKGINKYLHKDSEQFKQDFILRKELREELAILKKETHALQEELDGWKQKYYHQVELISKLKLDVTKLTEELEEYKKNTGQYISFDEIPRAD